jgi:hypothetical protein
MDGNAQALRKSDKVEHAAKTAKTDIAVSKPIHDEFGVEITPEPGTLPGGKPRHPNPDVTTEQAHRNAISAQFDLLSKRMDALENGQKRIEDKVERLAGLLREALRLLENGNGNTSGNV